MKRKALSIIGAIMYLYISCITAFADLVAYDRDVVREKNGGTVFLAAVIVICVIGIAAAYILIINKRNKK